MCWMKMDSTQPNILWKTWGFQGFNMAQLVYTRGKTFSASAHKIDRGKYFHLPSKALPFKSFIGVILSPGSH